MVYIRYASTIITGIFILEMVMKVLVYGLVKNGPDSYLKDGWNVFDFVIVIISIVNLIAEQFKTSS